MWNISAPDSKELQKSKHDVYIKFLKHIPERKQVCTALGASETIFLCGRTVSLQVKCQPQGQPQGEPCSEIEAGSPQWALFLEKYMNMCVVCVGHVFGVMNSSGGVWCPCKSKFKINPQALLCIQAVPA